MKFSYLLIICLSVICTDAHSQNVDIDSIFINEDSDTGIAVINKDINELPSLDGQERVVIVSDSNRYTLDSLIKEFQYGVSYSAMDESNNEINIYFTNLPVLHIKSDSTILDEPRVYARFSMCESNGNYIESDIGVEYRGGWTQTLPKKSLRIEFWQDKEGSDTEDYSLLGMRSDDDWNIQALYNEPLRIRSKVNYELWRKIDTIYYLNDEPDAVNAVRQEYVEVFLNDKYSGVYLLSERPDRKQFKLKKYKDSEIRGELYKGVGWGASTFTSLPNYNNNSDVWGGFEYEYPDEEVDWTNLYEFVDFVINSDSSIFVSEYRDKFKIENAVNYFIFLNLLRATDNTGKNLYIAKYKEDEPYFYLPWDLDGTFGMIWNGTQEYIYDDILKNGFYKRLVKHSDFTDRLRVRWNDLRSEIITKENIMSMFDSEFSYLNSNGVYERELLAWENCEFFDFNNLGYTESWLRARLEYLDYVFNNPEILTDISPVLHSDQLKVYPNPASYILYLESDYDSNFGSVKIVNALGDIVYSSNEIIDEIDVSGFYSGFYFVIISLSDGSNLIEKILIKS